jgi:serine/threonine protein kinase
MGCVNARNSTRDSKVVASNAPENKEKIKSKYLILPKVLGSGRTGTVYAASLRSDQNYKVAIKVINKAKFGNQTSIEFLKNVSLFTNFIFDFYL